MRTSRTLLGITALACLAFAAAPSADAAKAAAALAVPGTVLDLQFNEPAGSTVAVDDSGMGHDGAIGSHLRMNGVFADWDRHSPSANSYFGADHLIMVPDAADASLDPGTSPFTVEIRMRTTDKFGNIIQKGQAKSAGGQVKFQQPGGFVSCLFKNSTSQAAIKSSIATNDGQWHVIRCERTTSEVRLYIDGVFNKRIRKTTGNINNTKAWTIGGKFECDPNDPTQGADSCDYFPGDLDYVTITKG
jgi:Concanavalin A-like lectin/glucanases superfamily